MEAFLITVLKQGTLAFLGCKITKALNEKEISEIIAASGWAVIGVSSLEAVTSAVTWVKTTSDAIGAFFDKIPFM